MLERNAFSNNGWRVLAATLALIVSTLAMAVEFVPYPGKRPVTLVNIEAPNLIVVTFDTDAAGFFRTIRIRLPDLVVAQDTPRADECERAAAARAMAFTQDFLASVKKIHVQDMRMQNSADEEAISPILTDKGSLSAVLVKEGLARPDSVDPDTPWCT